MKLESNKLLMIKCSKLPARRSIIAIVANENIIKYIFCFMTNYYKYSPISL